MDSLLSRLFSGQTWERIDWLNSKYNKTPKEMKSSISRADYLPIILALIICINILAMILIVTSQTSIWLKSLIVGIVCIFLFIGKIISFFEGLSRILAISVTLVLMLTVPIIAAVIW